MRYCPRGDHWSPANLAQQRLFWVSFFTGKRARASNARPYKSFLTVCILIVRLFDQPDLLPDLKRLAAKTEFSSGDRDAGRQRNRALRKECFPNRLFHGKVLSVMYDILPVTFSVRNHHRRNHQSQSHLNQSHQNQGVNS